MSTIDTRPVLIGMNNPYGVDPKYALYPLPKRATGWRIWNMMSSQHVVTMREYADGFDRRNLQTGPWVQGAARACAMAMRPDLQGRTVVLFGTKVREAFLGKDLNTLEPCGSIALDSIICGELAGNPCTATFHTYLHWVPHPSGLNQWYNHAANQLRVGKLLNRLLAGERGLLTF